MSEIDFEIELIEIEKDNPNSWQRCTTQELQNEKLKNKDYIKLYNKSGVYVIKVNKEIEHFIGKSKIVYIGSSNKVINRLQNLFNFLYSDTDKYIHTAKGSLKRITKETELKLEVLFRPFDKGYKEIESKLIQKFMEVHIEKPPVNCNRK